MNVHQSHLASRNHPSRYEKLVRLSIKMLHYADGEKGNDVFRCQAREKKMFQSDQIPTNIDE